MEKMKKLLCISLILFAFACASDPQKEMEKAIVGEWCNPYTYQSTGELKGFNFKKGGVCESINIPSLEDAPIPEKYANGTDIATAQGHDTTIMVKAL